MKRMARAVIAVFLFALFLPALAAAQAGSTAQISGTVKDRAAACCLASTSPSRRPHELHAQRGVG